MRDPRVTEADNDEFLDLLEEYFSQPAELKAEDARPELSYQVGATPEGVEVPRCMADPSCLKEIANMPPEHRATVPPGADPKWRFMWRVGPRPASTQFAELNAEPGAPRGGP